MLLPVILVILALLALWNIKPERKTIRAPFPPGPKPLPVIGNIFDLTITELWLTASRWIPKYGSVTHVRAFSQSLVFLNTPKAAFDLLDKRSAVYSDRPHLVMLSELCGCEDMVAFTPYGDRARRQRKLMQKALGSGVIPRYHSLMEMENRPFLKRLVTSPARFEDHIKRYAGSLTLFIVYGYQVKSNDDPFLHLADECMDILANRISSGGGIWLVDIFPALKHLPVWFPGASFKRNAAIWKAKMEEFVNRPYKFVKDEINEGTARPSFVSTLLEPAKSRSADLSSVPILQEDRDTSNVSDMTKKSKKQTNADNAEPSNEFAQLDHDIQWTANSMYAGSIETITTVLLHFVMAMMQYPDVLARARAELDAVLGVAQRFPTFEDRDSLPYCDAVFTETLRWSVAVPLGLPHRLTEDDIYDGKFIPKGALIFANIWAILRDPILYPDPHEFKPERWLQRDVDSEQELKRDPRAYVFGFGRRRCPGSQLADSSMWLSIVNMLAVLDLQKKRDAEGMEIEPVVKFEDSVFRTPSPFVCDICPRNEAALRLIMGEGA